MVCNTEVLSDSSHRRLSSSSYDLAQDDLLDEHCGSSSRFEKGMYLGFVISRIALIGIYSVACWCDEKFAQQVNII